MRLPQLLTIVGSCQLQMRLARVEALLSERNKILQDTKLARQAQRCKNDDEEDFCKEQQMKRKYKNGSVLLTLRWWRGKPGLL